jgi:hypothetical protein
MLQPQAKAASGGGVPAECTAPTDASTGIQP